MARIQSIDSLRGLVMVLMTLDHTRDFFSNAHFNPTDLDKTTLALFLTRWVTHFCAPVFVFLAGVSVYLWAAKRGPAAPKSGYLCKRACLLLVLTCTVEAWAWDFRNDFKMIDGGVLWVIAWSMLVLAVLIKLPLPGIVGFGLLLIGGHNAFDGLKPDDLGGLAPWWTVLHTGGKVQLGDGWSLNCYYPLMPWPGVMAVGYGFGKWLSLDAQRTQRRSLWLGLLLMAAFLLLRYGNWYGDPDPWRVYPDPVFTGLSFLNCLKYPPSLLYLLMTLGPTLVVLAALAGRRLEFLQRFGRVPLFFYVLHLYVIHLLALAVAAVDNGPAVALLNTGIWSPGLPENYGYGLPGVYLAWVVVLVFMYPLCRAFESLKAARPDWRWLAYF